MPPPRTTRVSPTTIVIPRGGGAVTPARPSSSDPKTRALALIAEVHELRRSMSGHAYRLGVVLRELRDDVMVAALGCASFDELLVTHGLPNRMTAIKYIALAEHFAEAEAVALGPEKGYALVRYGQALARPEEPKQLLARSAKLAGVLLRDASTVEILRAARALGEKQRDAAAEEDDSAEEAARAVRRLGAKLRRAGAPEARLRRVRRGSTWCVVIELDPDEAAALAARL